MNLLNNNIIISNEESSQLALEIAKKFSYDCITYKLKIFADGESKITIRKIEAKIVIIIHSINPPVDSNLIRIISLIYEIKKQSELVVAVIPYMGYSRQDKVFLPGEVATIEVLSKLFEAVGVSALIVLDIHSNLALKKFNVPITNVSAVPAIAKYVRKLKLQDLIIVSPDFGGNDRAKLLSQLLKTEYLTLKKQRDRTTGEITIISDNLCNVHNKNIILIDDIISTGNSIINATKILKKNKCKKIFVCCTHAILVNDARKKIIKSGVEKIITTSTKEGCEKIDIASIMYMAIKNVVNKLDFKLQR